MLRPFVVFQVSLKYAFESKYDLFLILDLMTGGENGSTTSVTTMRCHFVVAVAHEDVSSAKMQCVV